MFHSGCIVRPGDNRDPPAAAPDAAPAPKALRQLRHVRIGRHRREGERTGARWIGRVGPGLAVNPEQTLCPVVVRSQIVIRDRPGRRDAPRVLDLAKILFPQPWQRRAIDLGVPTDEIMDTRREPAAARVAPLLFGLVTVLAEDGCGAPVLRFARQKLPALEEQHPGAAVPQCPGQRAAAHSRPDDHHVGMMRSRHEVGVDPSPSSNRRAGPG